MIFHNELASLVKENAVRACHFVSTEGGFLLNVHTNTGIRVFHSVNSKKPRIFAKIDTGFSLLHGLGFFVVTVDISRFFHNPRYLKT